METGVSGSVDQQTERELAMRLFSAVLALSLCGCTFVPPGEVGIKVNSYGQQKGVEDFPLKTGRVWYNPMTEDIYRFPTFMQNRSWSGANSITFNSVEGAQITADIGLNYSLNAEKVPELFIKHRQTIDHITDNYVRNKVRDTFNRVSGSYKAVEIFGSAKQKMLDEVKVQLEKSLEGQAFLIDSISFIGSPRGDSQVMESINQVISATQRAVQAEEMVRQKKAEAEQKIAEAEGQAQSIQKVAEAQAQANKKVMESLTPELLRYKLIEKWDGVAPRVMGEGGQLLLNVDTK